MSLQGLDEAEVEMIETRGKIFCDICRYSSQQVGQSKGRQI